MGRTDNLRAIFRVLLLGSMAASSTAAFAALANDDRHRSEFAVVGATLIDVSGRGLSEHDVPNSVVLIDGDRIVAAGSRAQVRIPRGVRTIDATGEFIVPGLIDGYGAMRNPRFAAAYLFEGVTTVVVPTAPRGSAIDGEAVLVQADPGPSVVTMAPVSGYSNDGDVPKTSPWADHRAHDVRLTDAALQAAVARAATAGAKVIAVQQDVWPEQLAVLVAEAHRRNMGVAAQPAFTTYPEAVRSGVDAFTRNDHYSLSVTPAEAFAAYANDPKGPGARQAVRAVCRSEDFKDGIAAFGSQLSRSNTALMPILSMEATADDVGGPNPWTLRSAAFVTPSDLDDPVDPKTGARPYLQKQPDAGIRVQGCARSKKAIDRGLHAQGATYLAGTSTPSYGVMPGGGLHIELRLLQEIGLTPREALASATGNLATAFHLSDRGQIARGKRADLVLLRDDPRKDVANVDAIAEVILGGQVIDRANLLRTAAVQTVTKED